MSGELYINTLSWSEDIIHGFMSSYDVDYTVVANNPVFDEDTRATGEMLLVNVDSRDKEEHLLNIRYSHPSDRIIYVGNGLSDIRCLMDADVPIFIGENRRIMELLAETCPHIWFADNWYDVVEILEGIS